MRLIVQPILDYLRSHLGSPQRIQTHLTQILQRLQGKTPAETGYIGGNSLNLLRQLGVDLTDQDFSELTVWHADLQGVTLHRVNFAHCDLSQSVFTQPFGNIHAVAFSPDGTQLAAGDSQGTIRLWRVADGQPLLTCQGHTNWVCAVAFSPDGQSLASGSADGTVKYWDVHHGICLQTYTGHLGWVWSVAFSSDGTHLVSGSEDRTLRLWDVESGECLNTMVGHRDGVRSVALSPMASMSCQRQWGWFDQTLGSRNGSVPANP